MDCGTLFQLQKLINRRNVVKDPSKVLHNVKNFFPLIVESHILQSFMNMFGMESKPRLFPTESVDSHSLERRIFLLTAVNKFMSELVDLRMRM